MMLRSTVTIAMLAALTHPSANAADQDGDLQFFETHVRPLLVEHCYECHNSTDDAQGGLAVDWRGGLIDGGDSGTAIVPGNPEASLLLQVIRHEVDGLEMPEGAEKLDDESIKLIERWIRDRANDPRAREPSEESSSRDLSWQVKFDKRKEWWSLQPVAQGSGKFAPTINPWDQHQNLEKGHADMAEQVDQPVAALLKDLKRCGLLEETIVLFSGEFGRTSFAQGSNGRDHDPYGFSLWVAGGGFKGGHVHGATDEFGYEVVENEVNVYSLWATIQHQLGLDHERATYHFAGRDYRLSDVEGHVIHDLIS